MKLFALTASLAACAIALPAAAQTMTATTSDTPPPMAWWNPMGYAHDSYVEVDGGTTFTGHTRVDGSANGLGAYRIGDDLRPGIFGSALVGHNLTPALAIELEGVYARNHEDSAPLSAYIGSPTSGSLETYGALANVKLRIPYTYTYRGFGVTPYVAVGAGYGTSQYRLSDGLNAQENGLMWQGKAGLEIKTGTPVSFDVGYRYLHAPDYETPGAYYGVNSSAQVKSDVQAATIGVRYSF
jgi:opacity protein-like surface antigen